MESINLNSVNFEHGMLLTPEHFLRQERYFDSTVLWLLRYASGVWGLIGAGPRADEGEGGSVRYDPVVTVVDEEEFVHVTVGGCRALTPSGCLIDIPPESPISQQFAKTELDGATVCGIRAVATPHEKEATDGPVDEFNPQMQTERRARFRLSLRPPGPNAGDGLVIGRIRKSRSGTGYERDSDYIPPCVNMLAHSELAAAWRRVVEEAARLLERTTGLYRAMPEFLALFRERGIETDVDAASLALVGQILSAVHVCLYEILDPLQTPQRLFGCLRRLFHFAALQIDLSPQVQGYFETLRESGETEFIAILEAQRRIAREPLVAGLANDLGVETRAALRGLADLHRLEAALEGKYMDFRLNRSLESMNFVFERGGKVLYRLAAKPSRMQATAGDMVVTFARLRLEGRERYRLILVGEHNASFEIGSRIAVEVRINEGSGFRRSPAIIATESRLADQRNFEFDFEAPDVPTITDVRVTFPAHQAIRTGLLYVRQRFYASAPQDGPAQPPKHYSHPDQMPQEGVEQLRAADGPRRRISMPYGGDAEPPASTQAPPRRRRLE